MNALHKAIGVLAICVGFVLGAQAQQQIASDYAPHTDFSVYKTYSWQKISAPDSSWEDSIKAAIDTQLAAKGWNRVDKGGDAALCAITSSGEAAMFEHFYGACRDGAGGDGPSQFRITRARWWWIFLTRTRRR